MLWPSPFGSPTRSRPRPSQPRGRECRSNSSRQVRGAFGDCSWNGVSRVPRIYISAGEPSGDAHAAAVVTARRRGHDRGGGRGARRVARGDVEAGRAAHGRVAAKGAGGVGGAGGASGDAWMAAATRKARAKAWAPAAPD